MSGTVNVIVQLCRLRDGNGYICVYTQYLLKKLYILS